MLHILQPLWNTQHLFLCLSVGPTVLSTVIILDKASRIWMYDLLVSWKIIVLCLMLSFFPHPALNRAGLEVFCVSLMKMYVGNEWTFLLFPLLLPFENCIPTPWTWRKPPATPLCHIGTYAAGGVCVCSRTVGSSCNVWVFVGQFCYIFSLGGRRGKGWWSSNLNCSVQMYFSGEIVSIK